MPSGTAACECLPLYHAVFVRDPFLPIKQLVKERLGMTARPINYLLRRAPAPVLFFYRRELAVELVEELLVAEASRSLMRHRDDCLLVSRSPNLRLIRERNEGKDRFSFSFFPSK